MKIKHVLVLSAIALIMLLYKAGHGYQIVDKTDVVVEDRLIGQVIAVELTCCYCGKSEKYYTLSMEYAPEFITSNWVQPFTLNDELKDYHKTCWNKCLKKIIMKKYREVKYGK